jgi:cbb3-type cytochrome oxidase subunit 3
MLEILSAIRPALVVVMFAVFATLVLWAYSPRRRDRLAECARIPLRDDDRL